MADAYFSDRETGPRPRTEEVITESAWGGICSSISSRITTGAFGVDYPLNCPDVLGGIIGTNRANLELAIKGEIPDLPEPLNPRLVPSTLAILDLIEFAFRHVAHPIAVSRHNYMGHIHDHLDFHRHPGQAAFREQMNLILGRNGLVYELDTDGRIRRLAPPVLREALQSVVFDTGDETLDQMLDDARAGFLSPDPIIRRQSLERLWDAWERIKTLEPGDKQQSVKKLLEIASKEENFRALLNTEAIELTKIGNNFLIRHSETNKIPITQDEHTDYLFHRMFAITYLMLKTRKQL